MAPLNILIVDDDPQVVRVLERLLKGHRVAVAGTAAEAIEQMRADSEFDVVLCDLMMPVQSGMELQTEVEGFAPQLAERIIFITGGAYTDWADDFLSRTRNVWLRKPFDNTTLEAAMTETVSRTR